MHLNMNITIETMEHKLLIKEGNYCYNVYV